MIVETADVAGTRRLGTRCARLLRPGDVLALSGDLGTGKTAFTQGLALGLGIARVVTSPTFVLVNEYPLPDGHSLQHVDCYRLADAPLEMWDVGLGDLVAGDDIVVIEWAERVAELLPKTYLEVHFTYVGENRRQLCFVAYGAHYTRVVEELFQVAAPGGQADLGQYVLP